MAHHKSSSYQKSLLQLDGFFSDFFFAKVPFLSLPMPVALGGEPELLVVCDAELDLGASFTPQPSSHPDPSSS